MVVIAVSLSDVQNVPNPQDGVKAGLVSSSESSAVPLKSVHVRARLVDLAAQVIVLSMLRKVYTDCGQRDSNRLSSYY